MRYLMPALIAEGVSDDLFLPFLLHRVIEDVCAAEFSDPVDVEQISVLRQHSRPPTISEMIGLLHQNADTFHLVFVHRDQDGSSDRVNREWIDPLTEAWGTERTERLIPVVPVRKTKHGCWLTATRCAPSWA